MEGKILIFSAPSGSGKTTIVRYLLERGLNLEFSVSATSRDPRGNEENGREYYFLSSEDFRNRISRGEFVEWEEVYQDHYYGTLKSEIERIWSNGNNALFDVDVMGGLNLKKIFSGKALAIFIQPPSIQVLKERLTRRGTDTPEKIEMRVAKARKELEKASLFDHIIVNDDLERSCHEAEKLVMEFIRKR